jgi:SAM-dependent methyltransferase
MPDIAEATEQPETLRRMAEADNYSRWLVDRGLPFLGARIIDLGAGIGTFSEMVSHGRELVVALEPDEAFSSALHERFADRSNITVVSGDIDDLPPSMAPFDTALCLNVLEHIPDDEATLNSLHARLSAGAYLLLLVPAHPFLFGSLDRALDHERRYRRTGLRQLLERTGFEVEQLRYVNPVGALGWLVSSRLLRRRLLPARPLQAYDRLVPLLRPLDRIPLPFGLSLWAVARKPA